MSGQSPRDTYRQIADVLRGEIAAARLAGSPLDRLGTEFELAARFNVARNTVRKALGELARNGLIHSTPTKGWFVGRASDGRPAVTSTTIAADLAEELRAGHHPADSKFTTAPTIAARYGVTLHAARLALIALGAQGLIESRHGKGWFVRK